MANVPSNNKCNSTFEWCGDNLSCTGIVKGDSMGDVIVKINNAICSMAKNSFMLAYCMFDCSRDESMKLIFDSIYNQILQADTMGGYLSGMELLHNICENNGSINDYIATFKNCTGITITI